MKVAGCWLEGHFSVMKTRVGADQGTAAIPEEMHVIAGQNPTLLFALNGVTSALSLVFPQTFNAY